MAKNISIKDFFIGEPIASATENQSIISIIEKYAKDIEKEEAEACEESLRIFLNC